MQTLLFFCALCSYVCFCSARAFHRHQSIHNEEMLSETLPPPIITVTITVATATIQMPPIHRKPLQPCGYSSNSRWNVNEYFNSSKRSVCYNNNRNNHSLCQSMLPQMRKTYVSFFDSFSFCFFFPCFSFV